MRRIVSLMLVAGLGVALQASVAAAGEPPPEAQIETAPPGSGYRAVSPVRVLDTRTGLGTGGVTTPVGPAGTIVLDLSPRVPASTTAVVLNVTGTAPTAPTFVTVYPEWTTRPIASSLNLMAGETRPNLVTVAVGSNRKLALYNNSGSVHLIADFAGYYALDANDAVDKFTALSPTRVFDTRAELGSRPPGPIGAGGVETIDLSGRVPASATAVVFNLTGTAATTGTYVTAWPTGTPRPAVSNLNLVAGATSPNLVMVRLGIDRKVSLYNNVGSVDLIADLSGFYTPDYGALFVPATPRRVLDTRDGTGGVAGPVAAGGEIELRIYVPVPAMGLVLNVTGTQPSANTYVTVWPGREQRPLASNLNLAPGQTASNLVAVRVGPAGLVSMYNNAGTAHLVADLAGYFALRYATCAVGCVRAWGSNDLGQLGSGTSEPESAYPQLVYGLSQVAAVSGDIVSGYALRTDGTVWAWGDNSRGELGNGWTGDQSAIPVPVVGLNGVVAIDGSVALREDGTVWAWGRVPSGGSDRPAQVPGLSGITAVAAGFGTGYALREDGTLWAWGYNTYGALGSGTDAGYSVVPVQVRGLTGIRAIAGRMWGALALRSDGTLWSWGNNDRGQLGSGTVGGFSNIPVRVTRLAGVSSMGLDLNHGFAVLADGTAWAWGSSYHGGLGTGQDCDTCDTGTPVQVAGLANVVSVDGMGGGGYAVDASGRVWSWGDNSRQQLGQMQSDPGPYSTVPLQLREPVGVAAVSGALAAGFALVP